MSNDKSKYLLVFSSRLKEERKRIDITQEEIAKILKITSMTWGKYERGITLPDAYVLFELSKLGFDIFYLITGNKSPIYDMNDKQERVMRLYCEAPQSVQSAINSLLDAFKL